MGIGRPQHQPGTGVKAMATPIPTPRLSLLVQSADPHPDAVVLEDLRTGRRERFESLQALASHWLPALPDPAPRPRESRCDNPNPEGTGP